MIDAEADTSNRHQLNGEVFSALILPAETYDLTSLMQISLSEMDLVLATTLIYVRQ